MIRHRTIAIDGLDLFYREAGDPGRPAILLLHGFPASSFMFRDLMVRLEDAFYLIAPDYPGFGHSAAPSPEAFAYTFDRLAEVVEGFSGKLADCPMWAFDGSSTEQAPGGSSDLLLKPVALFPDPARKNGWLVMTEVLNANKTPHATNGRATINDPDDMARLFELGVDGIVSDYPARVCAAIRTFRTRR